MSTDTLMIPRSPEGPPPRSPAVKNTTETKKEAKARETAAKKETKAREIAANKQRKSAEVARKKLLSELKKNQKKIRLAAEKEEKKQARIAERQARVAAQQAQRVAQREALVAQRRADYERRLAEARAYARDYEERRAAARLANEEAAPNAPAIGQQADARRERNARRNQETQSRQIHMMSRCLSDTTADIRGASRTQEQLTCATTAFQTDECPICLEDLGETNCMVLRCGHKTCGDCILRHFQSVGGRKCPVCRDQYAVRVKGWIAPTPYGVGAPPPYNI